MAIKVPIFPFHIWLPEAHVEAPTTGSVILASLLLKLGGYGFLRFLLPLFPQASCYYLPFVYTVATISILYASLTAIRQIDLKRIIAYSSVAHMNLAVLGIFSFNIHGISGSIMLMLGHGIISGSLFLMIGILYSRYHSKLIYYFGGITTVMPGFSCIFFIVNLSNFGMPGSSNFVGEALVLFGVFNTNTLTAVLACVSMVFSAAYSLWMYNRVTFGTLKLHYSKFYMDINRREFYMLFPLVIANIVFGIYPNAVLKLCYPAVKLITLLIFKN
jgi:NADH-quinone oxidoreductase subunit M